MQALTQDVPVVSADAGTNQEQQDPTSPAMLARRSKFVEIQSSADMKYDATAPPRVETFQNWVTIQWDNEETRAQEITLGFFLASAVLLLLYAAAPNPA
jgi:hypothetical protein